MPPKKRAVADSQNSAAAPPSASRSLVSASFEASNPFVKGARADGIIAKSLPSGTRNKNSGFDGISKRKRVRLDKREKKKEMALAGKLKGSVSKEVPSLPLEVRAKRDAMKERERKKRQKIAKKLERQRIERSLAAASAPTASKKRRSRSQVAADAAAAAAAAAAAVPITASSVVSSTDASNSHEDVGNVTPSKKMIRKLKMKEKRAAAKVAPADAAVSNAPANTSVHDKMDQKKRSRVSEAAGSVVLQHFDGKKNRSANDFPYAVDSSDHAETPAGAF